MKITFVASKLTYFKFNYSSFTLLMSQVNNLFLKLKVFDKYILLHVKLFKFLNIMKTIHSNDFNTLSFCLIL